jgi:hypothetical protein
MGISSPAAAAALVDGLRGMLHVSYVPLHEAVARLDTCSPEWVLYLDSDSPPEDHCWAMLDVLRVLTLGAGAAGSATPVARLRAVRD